MELIEMQKAYSRLLEKQKFVETDLDYSILEKHKPVLQKLAETSNSFISVFDMFQKKHVFHSNNFDTFL